MAIQAGFVVAPPEIFRKALTRRWCLIHWQESSTCRRQGDGDAVRHEGEWCVRGAVAIAGALQGPRVGEVREVRVPRVR